MGTSARRTIVAKFKIYEASSAPLFTMKVLQRYAVDEISVVQPDIIEDPKPHQPVVGNATGHERRTSP
jgi:hypothetical protein